MGFINYSDPSPWIWIFNNEGKKVMWFENPKCASTSIKKFIGYPKFGYPGYTEEYRFKIKMLKNKPAWNVNQVPPEKEEKIITTVNEHEELSKMYKFGICRDPYRRIVSNYRMVIKWPIKSGQNEKLVKKIEKEGLRFDEFIDNVVSEKWKNHHWAPQHFFLPLEKIKIDRIFRLEKLAKDFQLIFDKLGVDDKELEYVSPIPHHKLVDYDLGGYLKNKETVRKIEEYYVKDFELYEGVDA